MNLMEEKRIPLAGLTFHAIETLKYKTNTIVLKWKAPLTEENVTKRALLPHILQSGTTSYPTVLQLRTKLDELYGASLDVHVAKKGEYQIITFRMEIANEKYLTDSTPLLQNGLQLLAEIVLSPILEDGAFLKTIVEKEKRALKSRIQAVYDDKMRYANMRLIQEMCAKEPYRLYANGNIEDLEKIDARALYEYYLQALQQDEIDLYVIGDIQTEEVQEMIEKIFTFPLKRTNQLVKTNVVHKKVDAVQEVIEEQDIKQGKLHMGCRTNITYAHPAYYALQVCNGIFGGFSHSKLFMNVREKESLAYYAVSRLESHKGLLMIMSGIEPNNYQKCVDIIKKELEQMKKGHFSDFEIEQTKAMLKNQILEMMDTAHGFIEFAYQNVISGMNRTIEEWLDNIEATTKEEIIAAANKIELDTIYFLKGKKGV